MNIKFSRGIESALPSIYTEGQVYFCTDTGNIFFDTANSRIQVSESYIDNLINNVNTKIDNLTAVDVGALPITGGELTGILYTSASTPLLIGKQGKVGMRAATADNNNVGQINISNSWYTDGDQWGAQMSALNGKTNRRNSLRVSHNGVEYEDENEITHQVLHNGNFSNYAVPINTTINGKPLTGNITLSADDVKARSNTWLPTLANLGITATATELNILDGVTATATEINKLDGLTPTTTELNYVDGVTSPIQTQFKTVSDNITTLSNSINTVSNNLGDHTARVDNPHKVSLTQLGVTATATELNILDGVTATTAEINKLKGLTVTTTELNYIDGVTSNIQSQFTSVNDGLNSHVNNKSNPHGVTAAQAGALPSGNVSGTANYVPKFTAINKLGNSNITDDGSKVAINSAFIVQGAFVSYGEGVRVLPASDGWSMLYLSGNNTTSGTHDGGWAIGRRGEVGGKCGEIGDLTIENNGATGGGLTLHKNGDTSSYGSKFTMAANKVSMQYDSTNECLNFVFA